MKRNSKRYLYESIMQIVDRNIKKVLNENALNESSKASVIKLIKLYINNCKNIQLLQSFVNRTLTQDEIDCFTSYCYLENAQTYTNNLVDDDFLYDNFYDLVNARLKKLLNITNNRDLNYKKGAKLLVDWFLKYIGKSYSIVQTIDDWRYERPTLRGSSKACQTELKRIIKILENDLDIYDIDNILKDIEHLCVDYDIDKSIKNVREYFNV